MKDLFVRDIDESRRLVLRDDQHWYCLDAGESEKLWDVANDSEMEMAAEIQRLREIADRLPKDADGNPVTPEAELVSTHYGEIYRPRRVCEIRAGGWRFYGSSWYKEGDADRACYGSAEAAEKAKIG